MPRLWPLTVLLVLLLATPADAARSKGHCQPRKHEVILARSGLAIVFSEAFRDPDEEDSGAEYLIGCSRRTGRRRVIGEPLGWTFTSGEGRGPVRLAGTMVAYQLNGANQYEAWSRLVVDDAIHKGRRPELSLEGESPDAWTLGPGGELLWLRGSVLRRYRWREGLRTLDAGAKLTNLRVGNGMVHWFHGPYPRARSLALEPTRCAPSDGGTAELDTRFWAGTLTVCRRATGVTLTVPGARQVSDAAGAFAVVERDGAVLLVDTVNGRVETLASGLSATMPCVDAHGSAAWVVRLAGGTTALWVRDAGGTRAVAKLSDEAAGRAWLQRDGSTLHWGSITYTLRPAAAAAPW